MSEIQWTFPPAFQFLFEPQRFKVMYGGRGAGKSWSVAAALLILGYKEKKRILCTREYQSSISESVRSLLSDLIITMGLSDFYTVYRDWIQGANGTKFVFYGIKSDPAKVKSMNSIDYCWCEEAESMSEKSLGILTPTIRNKGSECWFTMNTGSIQDPIYKRFIAIEREDTIAKLINYTDNPYFPAENRREMEIDKKLDYERYLHVWMGEPLRLTNATVFTNWEVSEKGCPRFPNNKCYYGLDWGYANDPTVLIKSYIDREKRILYVLRELYGHGVEIDDYPKFLGKMPYLKQYYITADVSRPELRSHLNARGYHILKHKGGNGSIFNGVEFLKNFKIIVDPSCEHTIHNLTNYKYEMEKNSEDELGRGLIKPKHFVDKYNDCIDALRYAVSPAMKEKYFSIV